MFKFQKNGSKFYMFLCLSLSTLPSLVRLLLVWLISDEKTFGKFDFVPYGFISSEFEKKTKNKRQEMDPHPCNFALFVCCCCCYSTVFVDGKLFGKGGSFTVCYLIYLDLKKNEREKSHSTTTQNTVHLEHKYTIVRYRRRESGSICDEHSLIFVSWSLEISWYNADADATVDAAAAITE